MYPCFDFGTVLIIFDIFDPLGKINLTIRVYAFGKFTRNKHIQVDNFFRYRIYRKCSTYCMYGQVHTWASKKTSILEREITQ